MTSNPAGDDDEGRYEVEALGELVALVDCILSGVGCTVMLV